MQSSHGRFWLASCLILTAWSSVAAQSGTDSPSLKERLRAIPGRISQTTRATMDRLSWRGGKSSDTFEIPLTIGGTSPDIDLPVSSEDVLLAPFGAVLVPVKRPKPTLDMGMPAPSLKVAKWLQGEPIKKFDDQHVYVVSFWQSDELAAEALAHLDELQHKYADRGLVVIAQHCWEDLSGPAPPFLKKMDDPPTCRIALDNRKGTMFQTWAEATGDSGTPTAFVVDRQQRLAWYGHTMFLKEPIVSSILDETFSIDQAKRDRAARREFTSAAQKFARAIDRAMKAEDWDNAERIALQFEREVPEKFRFSALHMRFKIAAGRKDGPAVNRLARQLGDDPEMKGRLNDCVAYDMALMTEIEGLDLSIAEEFARREIAEFEGPDKAAVLDTLACLVFRLGRQDEAIAAQKEAITLAEESERAEMVDRLKSYEKGELPVVKE